MVKWFTASILGLSILAHPAIAAPCDQPEAEILANFAKTLAHDPSAFALAEALITSGLRGRLATGKNPLARGEKAFYFQVTCMPAKIVRNAHWGFLSDSRLYRRVWEYKIEGVQFLLLLKPTHFAGFITRERFFDPTFIMPSLKNSFVLLSPGSDSVLLTREYAHLLNNSLRIAWQLNKNLLTLVPEAKTRQALLEFVVEVSSYAAALKEIDSVSHQPFVLTADQRIKKPIFVFSQRGKIRADLRADFKTSFAEPADLVLRQIFNQDPARFVKVATQLVKFIDVEDFRVFAWRRELEFLNRSLSCIQPLVAPN